MELSDNMIKILDELGKRFGIAIDWTSANLLPYIQDLGNRIIKYEIMSSYLGIVSGIIVMALCIIVTLKLYKKYLKDKEDTDVYYMNKYEFPLILSSVFTIFVVIANVICIPCEIDDILTANLIPEKIIMEQITDLNND